jgi:hypothetical protein
LDAVVVELPSVDTVAGNEAAVVEGTSVGNDAAAVEGASVDAAVGVGSAASVVDAADSKGQQPSEPSES